jgi:hypothetical protein
MPKRPQGHRRVGPAFLAAEVRREARRDGAVSDFLWRSSAALTVGLDPHAANLRSQGASLSSIHRNIIRLRLTPRHPWQPPQSQHSRVCARWFITCPVSPSFWPTLILSHVVFLALLTPLAPLTPQDLAESRCPPACFRLQLPLQHRRPASSFSPEKRRSHPPPGDATWLMRSSINGRGEGGSVACTAQGR